MENPNLSKTNQKQQRQRRQQSKKQEHQELNQPAQQLQCSSLTEGEPAIAFPTLEEQLDIFAELLIDLYLQDQQNPPNDEDEQSKTNLD